MITIEPNKICYVFDVDGEGKKWRFMGVWAKNRWEWTNTLLACMHYNVTTVGFYDAQS